MGGQLASASSGGETEVMSPVNVSSIGSFIREQREQARISVRQLSQAAGVSSPYLSQIERGLRKPSADILQQIAKGLRISAEVLYVQAGILEDRPAGAGIRDAVLADPELTERQKQILIELYESFRKESAPADGTTADETPAGQVTAAAGEGNPVAGERTPAAGEGTPADGEGEPGHMVPSPAGNR
jgi:transcriptional regulator with XRE-family HTH domain